MFQKTIFNKRNKNKSYKAGFTLAEMIVVVGIFTVLTSIIVFNYGKFTSNTIITNMAYQLSLIARQAQTYGLGSRGVDGTFQNAYGLYINLDADSEADTFYFFLDSDDNGLCDGSSGTCVCDSDPSDECLELNTINRQVVIDDIQLNNGSGCSYSDDVAITFKRPNPDAKIKSSSGSGYEYAQIRLGSNRSDTKDYVIIMSTGQISVQSEAVCD